MRILIKLLSVATALVGVLGMTPVVAQDPPVVRLPAVFKVVGLTQGDVLNVRRGAGVGTADIGDLQSGQKIEVTRFDTTGTWARILWQESNAWVSRRYLEHVVTPVLPITLLPANMTCFGTEPFWSLLLSDGQTLTLQTPAGDQASEPVLWEAVSANHTLRLALASASWRGLVQKKICSDGMSDTDYGLQIDLIGTGGDARVLSGCCRHTP